MRLITVMCAVAATLVLGAGTSSAATGSLVINDKIYDDPSGCIVVTTTEEVLIDNITNSQAKVYASKNCTGQLMGYVDGSTEETFEEAGSVLI